MNHNPIRHSISFFLFIVITMVSFGCNEDEYDTFSNGGDWSKRIVSQEYLKILKKHFNNPKDSNENNILLNYKLGWDKNQVNSHSDSLINCGILLPKSNYPVIYYDDFSRRIDTFTKWVDFKYKFQYFGSNEGLLCYSFKENKLTHLKLFILDQNYITENYIPNTNDITMKKLLTEKYGYPIYDTVLLEDEYSNRYAKVIIWLSGNKEIQLVKFYNLCYIQYTEIKQAIEREEYSLNEIERKRLDDSIELERKAREEIERTRIEKKTPENF